MILLVLSPIFSFLAFAGPKKLQLGNLNWPQILKKSGVLEVNICGSAEIQNSISSLKQDFLIGNNKKGYLLSGLISIEKYRQILKTQNLISAKEELKKTFSTTTLWEVSEYGEVRNLGFPVEVQLPFTATVMDCMNGAKTTLGMSCSNQKADQIEACCSEKFIGPIASWKNTNENFTLNYSPDPSIKLKVPNEKSIRFCHAEDSLIL